jgi:hypothetical protein
MSAVPASAIRIDGRVAYVSLTRGYEAIIDARDIFLVEGRRWTVLCVHHLCYAVCQFREGNKWRALLMHRVINGALDGFDVDHANGDGLDNRRRNLRACTRSENLANRRRNKDRSNGFKGVQPRKGGYVAKIRVNGKTRSSYGHKTAEDAASAYDAMAIEAFGQFALTNFGSNIDERSQLPRIPKTRTKRAA